MVEAILIFVLGLVIGYRISARIHLAGFREILRTLKISDRELIAAVKKTAPKHWEENLELAESTAVEREIETIHIKLEQHHGQIYAFRKDNDRFVAQGPDAELLIQRLNEVMKPCRIHIAKDDGADLVKDLQ